MYTKRLVLMIVIALCLLPVATVKAQSDQVWQFVKTKLFGKEYIEIGGQVGAAGYMGDIDNQLFGFDNKNVLGFNSYSGGVSVKRYFNPINAKDRTWGIRLDANYIRLRGEDAESGDPSNRNRNLQFYNNVFEGSLMGEFHFYEFRPNRMRNLVSPYVFAGIGMIYHNPKAKNADGTSFSLIDEIVEAKKIRFEETVADLTKYPFGNVSATSTDKYSKTAFIIPVGTGV